MKSTLLMIPGTLCDETLFQHQQKALQDIAHCQVVDHSTADNLPQLAEQILHTVQGDFSVMGLSYGGIIAFELWRQAPQRVKRLILLNTTHRPPTEATRALLQKLVLMAVNGKFREITSDILKDAMLHPHHAANQALRNVVLQMALNTGREKYINQVKSQLGRPDSTADLPNIHIPALVITGRQDKFCTPEIHAEIARLLPYSTLEVIEECGHLSTLEQPEKVSEIIRQWWLSTAHKNWEEIKPCYAAK